MTRVRCELCRLHHFGGSVTSQLRASSKIRWCLNGGLRGGLLHRSHPVISTFYKLEQVKRVFHTTFTWDTSFTPSLHSTKPGGLANQL